MKYEEVIIPAKVERTLILNGEEADAFIKLIGEMSITSIMDAGLTEDEAYLLSDVYDKLKLEQKKIAGE